MNEIFCENYKQFLKSVSWLERSLSRVENINEVLKEEDIEKYRYCESL